MDGTTSTKTYTFVASAEATLSFDWSVSSENGCDKYYMYNQGLLLGERQQMIMADIQNIEKELSFLV